MCNYVFVLTTVIWNFSFRMIRLNASSVLIAFIFFHHNWICISMILITTTRSSLISQTVCCDAQFNAVTCHLLGLGSQSERTLAIGHHFAWQIYVTICHINWLVLADHLNCSDSFTFINSYQHCEHDEYLSSSTCVYKKHLYMV